MDPLWLLKGDLEAPGWKALEADSKADKVKLIIFDLGNWAIVQAAEAPQAYEGLVPAQPRDGLYISEHGFPLYVVGCCEVRDAKALIEALGEEATAMLEETGDELTALQRLGRVY